MNLDRRLVLIRHQDCIRTGSEKLLLRTFSLSYGSDRIRTWLGLG